MSPSTEKQLLQQSDDLRKSVEKQRRQYELEPMIEQVGDSHTDSIERHPAYAHIYAGRVQGQTLLYGSDFVHHNYIKIEINVSELHRNLSNDWHHSGKSLIEVNLSEAQWATFVSSLNSMGTQCTLSSVAGAPVPSISRKTDRREQFRGEVAKRMADADKKLVELEKQIEDLKLSQKQRDALSAKVESARSAYQAGVPFITDQFDEHMENTVERAKTEVNAYATQVVQRAGLSALRGDGSPAPDVIELSAGEMDADVVVVDRERK